MIRLLPRADRQRLRAATRRQWRPHFVPIAIVQLLVLFDRLETRWSQTQRKRLWRAPLSAGAAL